jgi:hypothetical protein
MASKRRFSLSSLIARLVVSLLLVLSTYNPSGYSIYHWLIAGEVGPISLRAFALLALAILYYAIFRAVFGAFRWPGLIAAGLVSVLCTLLLVPVVAPHAGSPLASFLLAGQILAPVALALIIAFGLSWSHLIQRLTGQLQKRYVR